MKEVFWLASFPKSGNTWVRALLSNYFSNSDQPIPLSHLRFGSAGIDREWLDDFLGLKSADIPTEVLDLYRPAIHRKIAESAPVPPIFKTHESFRKNSEGNAIFPEDVTAGVILVVRDPRDVVISMANFFGISRLNALDFLNYSDFTGAPQSTRSLDVIPQRIGSWSGHAESWLNSGVPFCIVRYEDLHADPGGTLHAILNFLDFEINLASIEKAVQFSNFDTLQTLEKQDNGFSESVVEANQFFDKGKTGVGIQNLTLSEIDRIQEAHGTIMQRLNYSIDRPI